MAGKITGKSQKGQQIPEHVISYAPKHAAAKKLGWLQIVGWVTFGGLVAIGLVVAVVVGYLVWWVRAWMEAP
jgi:hypothetical protein